MGAPDRVLSIRDLRGGMNSTDSPTSLPANQTVEALNVDLDQTMLGSRRRGTSSLYAYWASGFPSPYSLHVHQPGRDMNSAELFAWTAETTPRLARLQFGSAGFTAVTVGDAAASARIYDACSAPFLGRLYVAYDSSVDRMHLWNGTTLRRAGIAAPSFPSIAETAGAVTDTRKYRIRLTLKSGSVVYSRSEPSSATNAATLSSERATATVPGSLEAHATHWELEASSITTNYTVWYVLGDAVVATTTIEDNNASLLSFPVSAESGQYTVPPSSKYVVTDSDRVLFLNSWETTDYASRVWWTPVLGSGVGDWERIVSTSSISSYLDLAPGVGGQITGGARLQGSIYIFKQSAIFKLVRTGDVEAPYQPVLVSDTIGSVNQRSICEGEDEFGNPALYFFGRMGPYRISQRGVEFLGRDLLTYWQRVNWSANSGCVVHAVWYPTRKQVWYFVCIDSYHTAVHHFIFHAAHGRREGDAVRGGWTIHTGKGVTCSALYTSTYVGASEEGGIPASNTYPLRPWLGLASTACLAVADQPLIDEDAYTTNSSTTYTASFTTQPYVLGAADQLFGVTDMQLVSRSPSSSSYESRIKTTLIKDWGSQSDATTTTTATYSASITQVASDIELTRSGCTAIQVKIEDGAATTAMTPILEWNMDAITLRYRPEDRR